MTRYLLTPLQWARDGWLTLFFLVIFGILGLDWVASRVLGWEGTLSRTVLEAGAWSRIPILVGLGLACGHLFHTAYENWPKRAGTSAADAVVFGLAAFIGATIIAQHPGE